jgi:hypothetical protein
MLPALPALCGARRWTNGVYRSTLHRVVTPGGRDRYSCAFFYEPNFDTLVQPLPQVGRVGLGRLGLALGLGRGREGATGGLAGQVGLKR